MNTVQIDVINRAINNYHLAITPSAKCTGIDRLVKLIPSMDKGTLKDKVVGIIVADRKPSIVWQLNRLNSRKPLSRRIRNW
jgi:hypothetical protein